MKNINFVVQAQYHASIFIVIPSCFSFFTMIALKHLDIILANPQVHEKKGNLFKCSTENRFVLMTRGTI